ncbi:MAG TPA: hypothetical protein ENH19_00325 [Actinobacteria bacterium]|nr:hypothetical protein [Actinomycetes bacterium]HEX21082.1 hypothetical protein [Actinomycetota bacterium]
MLKKRAIKEIANIIAGYTFRGAITPSVDGNIFVLQAKDINKNEYIEKIEDLTRTPLEIPRSNSYLKYDDVLLTSRGAGNRSFKSTLYKSKADNVVASSSVYIIRIIEEKILPEYLSLYLNSIEGQKALYKIVTGAQIRTINRKDLDEMKVSLPTLEKQKILVAFYENINRQEKITVRIKEIKQNIMNAITRDVATN